MARALAAATMPVEHRRHVSIEANAGDVDGTVTNVAFFANATKLGEVTNGPYVLVWTNASAGDYQLTARATDDQGAISVSTAVEVFLTQSGGSLAAFPAMVSAPVDLDMEGPADWAHWGLYTESSFDRKRGVVPQISNCTIVGDSPAYPYSDNANTYSWADGTPTAAATNTATGIYVVGLQNGFRMQAPAGLTTNTLKVYVGAFSARGDNHRAKQIPCLIIMADSLNILEQHRSRTQMRG